MDNYLPNGSVLPFGLLDISNKADIAGFNKTYRNSSLRMGIIVRSYDVSDTKNLSKLTTEYDVLVFEQIEDQGSSVVTYRNCISAEGMGSIADFFERTLRIKESKASNNPIIDTKGQNGSVVLILCLDSVTEKAIIIGSTTHPDRKSTLIGKTKHLEGEFNGVNVKVDEDGAATFTFKGATDNDGSVIDPDQGDTVASIEKDGSFQLSHKTITFRMDKGGAVTIKSTGDASIECANAKITTTGDATVSASGTATVDGSTVKLGAGAAEAVIKGDTFKKLYETHTHPVISLGSPSGPPSTPLPPSVLSQKSKTE